MPHLRRELQPAAPKVRQSLAGARLRKHADFQRAYAEGRKRQSSLDELVSVPRSRQLRGRPVRAWD